MKKVLSAILVLSLALCGVNAEDNSVEELEKENQLLEMKLKNEKLKKRDRRHTKERCRKESRSDYNS